MKAVSAALAAHLAGPVTTLATCWRITRVDGTEFFFTDHDRDLVVDGEVYQASAGYSRTAIANDAGMGVDNLDVEGVFDSAAVTEAALRAGLFDRAEVRIFLVNWADPAMGAPAPAPRLVRRGGADRAGCVQDRASGPHPGAPAAHRRTLQPGMPG